MNPGTTFCPNLACPARGQTGQGNISIHSCKDRRFMCTECRKTFSARKGTALYWSVREPSIRMWTDHGSWPDLVRPFSSLFLRYTLWRIL